jgi:hypothetical protein
MKRIGCTFVISLATLAGCAELDSSSTEQESHTWGSYHWARTSNPFTLKVGDNLTGAWPSYLPTSVTDWSKSTVLDLTKVAGGSTTKRCTATTGRVEVCNDAYGNNGWLGIASISISGSHITAGTVKLNDTYYASATYNTPAWRNLVMCQEIGHTFGLAHQDENFSNANLGTCMDYTNLPSTNQHPNTHDYDLLQTIYAHLDSSTTVGLAASVDAEHEAGDSPAEWGELVSDLAGEGRDTYVRATGKGEFVLTHVSWVPPNPQ